MKFWITKYALTNGIMEVDAELSEVSINMIVVPSKSYPQYFHGEGTEWHRSKDSAIERAEKMRVAKIASLKKQIEKLQKVSF